MLIIFINISAKGCDDLGKFTSGLIAGSALGAVGLAIAMSDKRTRRRMLRDGRKAVAKANSFLRM
ncbi:MAG: hypothetical protein FWE33_03885 [Defluviitaleaceae bacterium]|nr:hypothetical protein [Defluviitaleaceae bacterium]